MPAHDDLHWHALAFAELSSARLYAIARLRQDVFMLEQNCLYPDLDGLDSQCQHLVCERGDSLLAYLRCVPPGLSYPGSSIGRIVVSEAARGLSLGRELVQRGIEYNRSTWPQSQITIGAQAHLQSFYESLGFVRDGDIYDEDGIDHIKMHLEVC